MTISCPHCQTHIEFDEETRTVLVGMTGFDCPSCGETVPTALVGTGCSGEEPASPVRKAIQTRKPKRKPVVVALAGLAIAGILLGYFMHRGGQGQREENTFLTGLLAKKAITAEELETVGKAVSDGTGGHLAVSRERMPWANVAGFVENLGATVLDLPPDGTAARSALLERLTQAYPELSGTTAWVTSNRTPATLNIPDVLSGHGRNRPRLVLLHWPAGRESAPPGNAPEHGDSGEFAWIPPGKFQIGDSSGVVHWLPTRDVHVSGFHVGKTELSNASWNDVQSWAVAHGYPDLPPAAGNPSHPALASWYNAVKWCNARSEKEGKNPCYFTDFSHSVPYRTGEKDLTNYMVKWDANGYRLPTAAEWEKAARGGARGMRFPWGETITHSHANYSSSGAWTDDGKIPPFDISPTRGDHPKYGGLSPVASFPPNGYGLHDVAGNAWDWTWDTSSVGSGRNPDGNDNPLGSCTSGPTRERRGGCVGGAAVFCAVALSNAYTPQGRMGFRIVFR